VIEHFNARHLTPADLPALVDIVTIDVSFISLRHILPVVPPVLTPGGDVVALAKPQFEAGRAEVNDGVITDPEVHARVVSEVTAAGAEVGLIRVSATPLPRHRPEGQRRVPAPLPYVMTITRVGIVAKRGLAAADHLDRLAAWLHERGVVPIYESETAVLARTGVAAAARGARLPGERPCRPMARRLRRDPVAGRDVLPGRPAAARRSHRGARRRWNAPRDRDPDRPVRP
jgi:hypothetical protein